MGHTRDVYHFNLVSIGRSGFQMLGAFAHRFRKSDRCSATAIITDGAVTRCKQRRSGGPHRGRENAHFHHRSAKQGQRGILTLQLIPIWLLVFAVFGVSLWIRTKSLQYLKEQRELDRCVYSMMEKRCNTLTQLSQSNAFLKKEMAALAAARAAKTAGVLIPVAGKAVSMAGKAAVPILKTSIKTTIWYQKILIAGEKVLGLASLSCGFPRKQSILKFERPDTPLAAAAGVEPALTWEQGFPRSEVWVQKLGSGIESFAHCQPVGQPVGQPLNKALGKLARVSLLDGEKYGIRFYHPQEIAGLSVPTTKGRALLVSVLRSLSFF